MSGSAAGLWRVIRMRHALLIFGLLVQIAALVVPGTAHADYIGPPYNNGDVDPATHLAVPYATVGEAVARSASELAAWCPTCVIKITYGDPASGSTVAATVIACVATSANCEFSNGFTTIWATETGSDPLKNAGGCDVCTGGAGGGVGGQSPMGSSGDEALENGATKQGSGFIGDPINFATGNKLQQETDFRSSRWLTFRRFYNSRAQVVQAALGKRWRHSFDRSLEIIRAGESPLVSVSVNYIIVDRPDGGRERFRQIGGIWTADTDVPDVLTEKDDASGNPSGYTVFVAGTHQFEEYSAAGLLLSIADTSGTVTSFTYSSASTPQAIAPHADLLLTVTGPLGRTLLFTYDSSARIQAVTLPDGGSLIYGYDTNDNLTSVTYPDSATRRYVYNEPALNSGTSQPNAMTGVIDESGVRFESTMYNYLGQATSTGFADGADATILNYGNSTIKTALGVSPEISFSNVRGAYKVGSLDRPCGMQCDQPWKYRSYDANGWPASYTDFNNNVTGTTYNSVGLETQLIEAKGSATSQRTTNTTWDNVLRNPLTSSALDATGHVVAQSASVYNGRGQVLALCQMDSAVPAAASYICAATGVPPTGVRRWTYTYCDAVDSTQCPVIGLLLSATGPRADISNVTSYVYYLVDSATSHHGDLKAVTDALGHTTTYLTYDGAGRVTSLQDANGVVTTMTYKPRGWLASRTVAGATTTFTYTPYGAIETVTDPDGIVTTYSYDDAHRLTKITDALGNTVQYTLDASGNRIAENTYAAGSSTPRRTLTRHFNTLGQMTSVVDGLGHTVFNATASGAYDANGNLVLSSDALGFQRKQGVDALNRLVTTIDNYNGSDVATRNTTSTLVYDALDQLTGVTDPSSLVTHYTYDGLGNRTALQSPDTGSSTDTYDSAGNRVTHTDARGVTATTTYDALGRLTGTTYPDVSLNVAYHYDEGNNVTGCAASAPIGRLTRVVESAVTTTYCYDQRGNISRKTQLQGSTSDVVAYTWTLGGRLASQTNPSGVTSTYTRDAVGNIASLAFTTPGSGTSTAVSGVTYLPFGPIASYTLGNNQTVTRTYDANYQATDVTSPALNLHFARDAMGDITALGNTPGAVPATETYSYDPLYRLTAVTDGSSPVESYTYSPTGDRLSKTGTGTGLATGTYSYTPGTHQLSSIGSAARTSDANGNTTASLSAGQSWGYGYNARNRMTVVQSGGVTVGSYTYNAMGQRVRKVANAVDQRFAYDEGSHLVGEYGAAARDYIWLGDVPVAVIDTSATASTASYVHADGLNTPRAISDASGTAVWSWAYAGNAFGEQQATSGSGYPFNLRFPGQYFDAESGLSYNVNRDYEAATGRYLQSDPIGLRGGMSTYTYVLSRPYTLRDVRGLAVGPPPTGPFPPEAPGRIPDPSDIPSNIPGGPWTPAGPGQRPGAFYGPKQPSGPKAMCEYSPPESSGGMKGSTGYWKLTPPGGPEQRFDMSGNSVTPEQAHPGNPPPVEPPVEPPVTEPVTEPVVEPPVFEPIIEPFIP